MRVLTCSSAPPWTKGTCASATTMRRSGVSGGKPEIDDIAVLDDVLLPLQTDLTVFAARGHRPARDERSVRHHFGADEPVLDVGVDLAGGGLRRGAASDRPGAAFVLTDREEGDVAEQIVGRSDHPIEA